MKNLKSTTKEKDYLASVEGFVDFSLIDENHGSLRTLFDPHSAQWRDSTVETKIEILKQILARGKQTLSQIIFQYKITFKNSPASKVVEDGLVDLLQYLLTQKESVK